MRELLLKLTTINGDTVLVGVGSIIDVEDILYQNQERFTRIRSRASMVSSIDVKETPEEIYEMYLNKP